MSLLSFKPVERWSIAEKLDDFSPLEGGNGGIGASMKMRFIPVTYKASSGLFPLIMP
jgi:hypothetical protein